MMELVSPNDVLFLKIALSGGAAAVTQSLVNRWLAPQPSPVNLPLLQQSSTKSKKNLPATRSIRKKLEQSHKSGIVFYGTQTGTAERLAGRLSREAAARYNLNLLTADLDDYDYADLLDLDPSQPVFFVLATYGEGEPTDNAITFNRYLSQLSQNDRALSNLTYAAFGLGSSAYQSFNAMILNVDTALSTAGAKRLGAVGLGDDGRGTLEEDFTLWSTATLAKVASEYGLKTLEYQYTPAFIVAQAQQEKFIYRGEPNRLQMHHRIQGPYTAQNPLPAKVVQARELYQSLRHCMHLEFDISGTTLQYETGDHLAVWPVNSDIEVERFIHTFGIADPDQIISISSNDPTNKVPIPSPTTYRTAARHYLDICAPVSSRVVQQLADFTDRPEVSKKLMALANDNELFACTVLACRMNLAQVLNMIDAGRSFESVPFSFLLENIPKLKPRHYSISSSSYENKHTISVTAVVDSLSSKTPQQDHIEFNGVCTSYLLALKNQLNHHENVSTHHVRLPQVAATEPHALIHVRSSNFRLPRDSKTPIIMIGPGTGAAPFRAFVKERVVQSRTREVGKTLLFYGCRDDEEFLYRNEWEDAKTAMPDDKFEMHTAFSRKTGCTKEYVQNILKNQAQQLSQMVLSEDACVYVCGDAKRMAKDVWSCFEDMVGSEYLKEMKKAGRWKEDVW